MKQSLYENTPSCRHIIIKMPLISHRTIFYVPTQLYSIIVDNYTERIFYAGGIYDKNKYEGVE
jgi:hypothetical protein